MKKWEQKQIAGSYICVQFSLNNPFPPFLPTLGLNDHLILLDMDKVNEVCDSMWLKHSNQPL